MRCSGDVVIVVAAAELFFLDMFVFIQLFVRRPSTEARPLRGQSK